MKMENLKEKSNHVQQIKELKFQSKMYFIMLIQEEKLYRIPVKNIIESLM